MSLPLTRDQLDALQNSYPMRGVWVGLTSDQKEDIANAVNGVVRELNWTSSPFVADNDYTNALLTYSKIAAVYAYILQRASDRAGDIGFLFDEDDDSYTMLDSYLRKPRPKSTDEASAAVNTGRIAPIEYV